MNGEEKEHKNDFDGVADSVVKIITALKGELFFGRIKLAILGYVLIGGFALAFTFKLDAEKLIVQLKDAGGIDVSIIAILAVFAIGSDLYMSAKDKKQRERVFKTLLESDLDKNLKAQLLEKIAKKL